MANIEEELMWALKNTDLDKLKEIAGTVSEVVWRPSIKWGAPADASALAAGVFGFAQGRGRAPECQTGRHPLLHVHWSFIILYDLHCQKYNRLLLIVICNAFILITRETYRPTTRLG